LCASERAIERDLARLSAGTAAGAGADALMASPDPTSKFHHTQPQGQGSTYAGEGHVHVPEISDIECFVSPDPTSKYHKTHKATTGAAAGTDRSARASLAAACSVLSLSHSLKNNFMASPVRVKHSRTATGSSSAVGNASDGEGEEENDGFGNFSPMPNTPNTPPSHAPATAHALHQPYQEGEGEEDGFGNFSPMPNTPQVNSEREHMTPGTCVCVHVFVHVFV